MHGQGSGDINKEDEKFFVLVKEIFLPLDLSFTSEKEFPIKNPLEIINMKEKIFEDAFCGKLFFPSIVLQFWALCCLFSPFSILNCPFC